MLRVLVVSFMAMCFPALAFAQSALVNPSYFKDPQNWTAVGRINVAGGGFCTGALVSESLVLTAGHCLYDAATGVPVDLRKVEFRAGWKHGRAAAYRRVQGAVTHPDFQFIAEDGMGRVANDMALLELDRPILHPGIRPFDIASMPLVGGKVGMVSYAHDRSEVPSAQEDCSVLAEDNGAMILNCTVDFGASGAPIFRFDLGVPMIVSVVSAKAKMGGESVTLGARARDQIHALQDIMMQKPAALHKTSGLPVGASFVQP